MHRFIQINEEGYVVGVHFNSVPFDNPLYIQWDDEIEGDIFNKRYVDGEFVEIEPEPTPEPEPEIPMQEILETMALNVEYLMVLSTIEEA